MALRRFPNVHGVTVMMPAAYTVPGEVAAFGAPRHGIFDIGRYPAGSDAADAALAATLAPANIASLVTADVMAGKYGKLLVNLRNIVEAALGPEVDRRRFTTMLRAEAEAVLAAAGIVWREVGESDPRRERADAAAPRGRGRARRRVLDPEPGARHRLDRDRLAERRDRAARPAARRGDAGQRLLPRASPRDCCAKAAARAPSPTANSRPASPPPVSRSGRP